MQSFPIRFQIKLRKHIILKAVLSALGSTASAFGINKFICLLDFLQSVCMCTSMFLFVFFV